MRKCFHAFRDHGTPRPATIVTTQSLRLAFLSILFALAGHPVSAQTSPSLMWDQNTSTPVTGYAVTIDGVRTDYGVSPLNSSGTCGCSIALPFSGGSHMIKVSAYNSKGETLSSALSVAPIASAGGPYSGQTGSAVTVNGGGSINPAGTITTYKWTWGDGQSTTVLTPTTSHTYTTSGTFTVQLTVTDNGGATASTTATATIAASTNKAPTVSLTTPVAGSTFTAPAAIGVAASASDSDGTVARVDFYSGSLLLGSATGASYSMTWNNVAAGNYALQAVATDNGGAKTTSAIVNITVSGGSSTQSPIALVQHAAKDGGSVASSSLGFPSANAAGNWIAVVLRTSSSSDVITVSDTSGNTYRKAVQLAVTVDPPTGLTLGMFYAENVKAGANTVTVSHTLSGTLRFDVLEYKGVATSNSLDVTATGQATSASPSSGSASPSASGDLLLGAVVTGMDANVTAGSGFTIRDSVPTAGASRLMVEDRVQATAGAASGAATLAASNNWGAALAAFKARVASLPGTPASPTPAAGATGASATMSLTWSATSATSYDVKFGTSNPPPAVSTSQSAATYLPATRAGNTTYFWQVVARNSVGATNGPVWSFTTAASVSLPGAPASPSPSTGTTGVSTRPSLTWTATGATSYDVRFGTTNPPPTVASAQSTATYSPATLANTTQYFWQVVARNGAGTTSGTVWSFTTGALASTPIALVQHTAKDGGSVPSSSLSFPSANIAGNWIAVVLRTSSSSDVVTVSDTNGNTYRKAVQLAVTVDPPTGLTLGIFYAENVRGGANTITVSHTLSGTVRFSIVEYSGVATSNSLDVTATGQGTSASPATGSATPTANGDLLLGAVVTGMDANVTAGSGYAIRDSVPSAGAARLTVEDKGQPVAGAASSSATLAASDNWGAALATFRAALR